MTRPRRVESRDVASLSLPDSPLFAQLPQSSLNAFVTHFTKLFVPCEQTIFQANDPGLAWTLVLRGSVAVFGNQSIKQSGDSTCYNTHDLSSSNCLYLLLERDSFGLNSLLESKPRSATFVAIDDCELLTINQAEYRAFFESINQREPSELEPVINSQSLAYIKQRLLACPPSVRSSSTQSGQELAFFQSLLINSSRIFQSLDQDPTSKLAQALTICEANTGDVIIRQDDPCEHFIIVLDGACSVHHRDRTPATSQVPATPLPATTRAITPSNPTPHHSNQTPHHSNQTSNPTPHHSNHLSNPTPHHLSQTSSYLTMTSSSLALTSRSDRPLTPSVQRNLDVEQAREAKLESIMDEFGEVPSFVLPPSCLSSRTMKPSELRTEFGSCESLLLPGQGSSFNDSILHPSFVAVNQSTIIAKQPTTFAYLSYNYICSIFQSIHKNTSHLAELSSAIQQDKGCRSEDDISTIDSLLLKNLTFFQFKQSRARRALCNQLTYLSVPADHLLSWQGEQDDKFYIVLSGSVALHSRNDFRGPAWSTARGQSVANIQSLIAQFGLCHAVVRPMHPLLESVLVSALPRSSSLITRTACQLLCLTRANYQAVCEPSSEHSSSSDVIACLIVKPPTERTADEQQLLTQALSQFHYLAEIRADLRPMVFASLVFEAVEPETRLFEENDSGDDMYIIVSGCVAVHLADKRERVTLRPTVTSPKSNMLNLPGMSQRATSNPTVISTPRLGTTTPNAGRASVSNMTPNELAARYGPPVTVLPAGSHFGELAFEQSGEHSKRSATIITVEPCLFLKLSCEMVKKINFMQQSTSMGSKSGREPMSQASIASFLTSLSIFTSFNYSLASMKRLAYHAQSRYYKQGDVIISQGQRAECLTMIVEGEVRVTRSYRVRHAVTDQKDVDHLPQQLNEPLCVLESPQLFPGESFLMNISLCSLASHASVGAHETLNTMPFSYSVTVSSASLHVLTVKRSHLTAFFSHQPRGMDPLNSEMKKRVQWWRDQANAEVTRQVAARLKLAEGDSMTLIAAASDANTPNKHANSLPKSPAELCSRLVSKSIPGPTVALHSARLNHLNQQDEVHKEQARMREEDTKRRRGPKTEADQPSEFLNENQISMSLIAAHTESHSKMGHVSDIQTQRRLGRTVTKVNRMLLNNEVKQQHKAFNLLYVRQLLVSTSDFEDDSHQEQPALDESGQSITANDTSVVQSLESSDFSTITHSDVDIADELKSLMKRREELAVLDPVTDFASQAEHPPRSIARAIDYGMPGHLHPSLRLPQSILGTVASVPSIPHSHQTREEIEEELDRRESKRLAAIAAQQLTRKHIARLRTTSTTHPASPPEPVSPPARNQQSVMFPLLSTSTRSLNDWKPVSRGSNGLREESKECVVQAAPRVSDSVNWMKTDSLSITSTQRPPSVNVLLKQLDRCQQSLTSLSES